MPNEFSKTENSLEQISVEKLSHLEHERSWQKIVMKHREAPVVSPWSWMLFVHSRVAVTVAALVILVAGGGTVAVADSAKPGDALFALDRAAESVRLVLAGDEEKSNVQLAFAEERLQELDEIILEESSKRLAFAPEAAQEARMFAPVAALQKAETAADQLQNAENANIAALEDTATDTNTGLAPADGEASATLMMAAQAPTVSEEGEAMFSDESVSKITKGIENAITNLEEVATSLDEKENEQARESVSVATDRLEEKLNAIPFEHGEVFRMRLQKIRERKGGGDIRDIPVIGEPVVPPVILESEAVGPFSGITRVEVSRFPNDTSAIVTVEQETAFQSFKVETARDDDIAPILKEIHTRYDSAYPSGDLTDELIESLIEFNDLTSPTE